MEEKDALYYSDLIFYLASCAGIRKEKDEERFKRVSSKIDLVLHKSENGVYYTPTEFSHDVFMFAKEIVPGYEWMKKGVKVLINYPEETKALLKKFFIKVAEDYSATPGARYIETGPYSGEDFRDNFLESKYLYCLPLGIKLIIDLDGGYGYSPCFLEEAFGGLVRKGYQASDLLNNIVFISDEEPELITDITRYIQEESERQFSRVRK